jgi:hypothetical protein
MYIEGRSAGDTREREKKRKAAEAGGSSVTLLL